MPCFIVDDDIVEQMMEILTMKHMRPHMVKSDGHTIIGIPSSLATREMNVYLSGIAEGLKYQSKNKT